MDVNFTSSMVSLLVVCLLCAASLAQSQPEYYSYSTAVGKGGGSVYSSEGQGRITAVRVWESYNSYITGFQLRYGYGWSPIYGRRNGNAVEMVLFDGEAIVQLSGKYHTSNYIRQLVFITNRGRFFFAGQPYGISFNLYPTHEGSELRILSGRFNGAGITSIGVHWGMVYMTPEGAMSGNYSMSSH